MRAVALVVLLAACAGSAAESGGGTPVATTTVGSERDLRDAVVGLDDHLVAIVGWHDDQVPFPDVQRQAGMIAPDLAAALSVTTGVRAAPGFADEVARLSSALDELERTVRSLAGCLAACFDAIEAAAHAAGRVQSSAAVLEGWLGDTAG